jgi:hypothetical protein
MGNSKSKQPIEVNNDINKEIDINKQIDINRKKGETFNNIASNTSSLNQSVYVANKTQKYTNNSQTSDTQKSDTQTSEIPTQEIKNSTSSISSYFPIQSIKNTASTISSYLPKEKFSNISGSFTTIGEKVVQQFGSIANVVIDNSGSIKNGLKVLESVPVLGSIIGPLTIITTILHYEKLNRQLHKNLIKMKVIIINYLNTYLLMCLINKEFNLKPNIETIINFITEMKDLYDILVLYILPPDYSKNSFFARISKKAFRYMNNTASVKTFMIKANESLMFATSIFIDMFSELQMKLNMEIILNKITNPDDEKFKELNQKITHILTSTEYKSFKGEIDNSKDIDDLIEKISLSINTVVENDAQIQKEKLIKSQLNHENTTSDNTPKTTGGKKSTQNKNTTQNKSKNKIQNKNHTKKIKYNILQTQLNTLIKKQKKQQKHFLPVYLLQK